MQNGRDAMGRPTDFAVLTDYSSIIYVSKLDVLPKYIDCREVEVIHYHSNNVGYGCQARSERRCQLVNSSCVFLMR